MHTIQLASQRYRRSSSLTLPHMTMGVALQFSSPTTTTMDSTPISVVFALLSLEVFTSDVCNKLIKDFNCNESDTINHK